MKLKDLLITIEMTAVDFGIAFAVTFGALLVGLALKGEPWIWALSFVDAFLTVAAFTLASAAHVAQKFL